MIFLQYSCLDTSLLSTRIMHPFWNYCVQVFNHYCRTQSTERTWKIDLFFLFFKFFPRWIAPNLLTFVGFLLTIVNFLLIGFYDFDFDAANNHTKNVIPRWVWITASINIFVAYTLGINIFQLFFKMRTANYRHSNSGRVHCFLQMVSMANRLVELEPVVH